VVPVIERYRWMAYAILVRYIICIKKCLDRPLGIASLTFGQCYEVLFSRNPSRTSFGKAQINSVLESNIEHISETIRTMSDLGMPNSISCVLSGPFTNAQKRHVEARMAIDRQRIIAAFQFISVNNVRYQDLNETPLENEFPEPLIVDSSEEDEDGNDPQEHIFETTVFFPDGTEVTPASGGHVNAHTFTVEALKQNLQGSASSLLTSRPTREYANDIGMHFLVDSFPLQFPYGLGGPREKRVTKVEYHECLEHYLGVANSNFMRPDFILFSSQTLYRTSRSKYYHAMDRI
jgi:hypothetical protein